MIGSWKRILFLHIFSSVALVQAKHHLILTHHPTSWSHPIQFSSCYSSSFNLPKVAASHLATPLPPPFLTCCVRYCRLHSSHLWLAVYARWRVRRSQSRAIKLIQITTEGNHKLLLSIDLTELVLCELDACWFLSSSFTLVTEWVRISYWVYIL